MSASPGAAERASCKSHWPCCPCPHGRHEQRGLAETPITYGMCLTCRSIEVALVKAIGTRDFSDIGESDVYPVGYGCEVCS